MAEKHESVNQVGTDETGTTSNLSSPSTISILPTRHYDLVLTQDPLSLVVGKELDGRELVDSRVLDGVGVVVIGGLGGEVLLGSVKRDLDIAALLDVGGRL